MPPVQKKIVWTVGMRVTTIGNNDLWGTVEKVVDRQRPDRPKIVGNWRWMLHVRWDNCPNRIEHLSAHYAFTKGDFNPRTGKPI